LRFTNSDPFRNEERKGSGVRRFPGCHFNVFEVPVTGLGLVVEPAGGPGCTPAVAAPLGCPAFLLEALVKLPALSVVAVVCSFQGQLMPTSTPASGVAGVVAVQVTDPVAVVTQSPPPVCVALMVMLTEILAAGQVVAGMAVKDFLAVPEPSSSEPVPPILAKPAKTIGIKSNLFHFMLRPPGLRFESHKESHAGDRPWLQLV